MDCHCREFRLGNSGTRESWCDRALVSVRASAAPQAFDEAFEVVWQRGFEFESFASCRVVECEPGGMERESRGAAIVLDRLSAELLVIQRVSTDQMSGFGQVDADLVRAAGLERAFDERETTEGFQRTDVRHRVLTFVLVSRAAAEAVAPVDDEVGLEGLRGGLSVDDRVIDAFIRVLLELANQMLFSGRSAGEDHDAAGVAIEPMDGDDAGQSTAALLSSARALSSVGFPVLRRLCGAYPVVNETRQDFVECGLPVLPRGGPVAFLPVTEGGHQCRLDDHDDMRVAVEEFDISGGRLCRARRLVEMDHVSRFDPATVVDANGSMDGDAARREQPFGMSPGQIGPPVPQCGDEGLTTQRVGDMEDLGRHAGHAF